MKGSRLTKMIAPLVVAASVLASTNAPVRAPEFTVSPVLKNGQVELRTSVYAEDERSHRLQYCTNLVEGTWYDSTVNTNLTNTETVRGGVTNAATKQSYVYEPATNSATFYRLVLNEETTD
jgi:hypothetical protein